MTLEPEGMPVRKPDQKLHRGAFHALLSVPLSREEIARIGNREGWTTRFCGRGPKGQKPLFHLIEVWVEDNFMLEVVPQAMVGDYEQLIQFEVIDKMMSAQAKQPA